MERQRYVETCNESSYGEYLFGQFEYRDHFLWKLQITFSTTASRKP